jgi:hypothetical protein
VGGGAGAGGGAGGGGGGGGGGGPGGGGGRGAGGGGGGEGGPAILVQHLKRRLELHRLEPLRQRRRGHREDAAVCHVLGQLDLPAILVGALLEQLVVLHERGELAHLEHQPAVLAAAQPVLLHEHLHGHAAPQCLALAEEGLVAQLVKLRVSVRVSVRVRVWVRARVRVRGGRPPAQSAPPWQRPPPWPPPPPRRLAAAMSWHLQAQKGGGRGRVGWVRQGSVVMRRGARDARCAATLDRR